MDSVLPAHTIGALAYSNATCTEDLQVKRRESLQRGEIISGGWR
jgi:hypothetical protein